MKKPEKGKRIDMLQVALTKATLTILTDYRGLKTPEMNSIRKKMQENGGDFKVVKNSLAMKAAERIDRKEVIGMFKGPMAVAFGQGEIGATAKAFTDFVRTSKISLTIKGGFMADAMLTPADITTLAALPPKPVLIARIIGGIKSPLYSIVGVLAAPMRDMQGVLNARIKQLEGTTNG